MCNPFVQTSIATTIVPQWTSAASHCCYGVQLWPGVVFWCVYDGDILAKSGVALCARLQDQVQWTPRLCNGMQSGCICATGPCCSACSKREISISLQHHCHDAAPYCIRDVREPWLASCNAMQFKHTSAPSCNTKPQLDML